MDYNNLKLRMWIFFGFLGFLSFMSWLNSSNFDSTEFTVIGGSALTLAGMLFGKEIKGKVK